MSDKKIDQLLDKTNGGADIIIDYFPQAKECLGTKKKFSIRCESDPSVSWYQFPNTTKWGITDWGESSKPKDAIVITMEQEHLDWFCAIQYLFAKYGIPTGKGKDQQIITVEPLSSSDRVGNFTYEEIPMEGKDIRYFGRCVKPANLLALNWIKVSYTRKVYSDKVVYKNSSDIYPIYIRKCTYLNDKGENSFFYKIYEPMNRDKGYRFRYEGEKPSNYVNGYYEACQEHEREIAQSVPVGKMRPVVICCGERDAAVAHSFGCKPIWYNSESAFPTKQEEINKLKELGPSLYFIPDIDSTGIKKGKELALRFPELKTAWLPMTLLEQKDWRGNPKKDLCDWASIEGNGYKSFHNMLHAALPADYFDVSDNGVTYIDDCNMHNYLWLNDYGPYIFKDGQEERRGYAHREGCKLVEIKQSSAVPNFLQKSLPLDASYSDRYNAICRSRAKKMSLESLSVGSELPYRLVEPTKGIEYMFFENVVVEVTADNVKCVPAGSFDGVAMEADVLGYSFQKPEQMPLEFTLDDLDTVHVKMYAIDSYLMRLVINMSRIYWHEEYCNSGLSLDTFYKQTCGLLESPYLTLEQNDYQLDCFINMCYTIGFIVARYKKNTEKWAPYLVDFKGAGESSNGRTGKGTLLNMVDKFAPMVFFDGRKKGLTDYEHAFDRVTPYTHRVRIDDYNPVSASFDPLYNMISDTMVVNPKNAKQFALPFEKSPKVIITSNHMLPDSDASTEGRVHYSLIGDWYHKSAPCNDYQSDHTPFDDFGIALGQDYKDTDWNNDVAFVLCCLQFYMQMSKINHSVEVPYKLLDYKRADSAYSVEFDEWMSGYVPVIEGQDVLRSKLMGDYRCASKDNVASKEFGRWLKAWSVVNCYDLNKDKNLDRNGRYLKYNPETHNSAEYYCFTKTK